MALSVCPDFFRRCRASRARNADFETELRSWLLPELCRRASQGVDLLPPSPSRGMMVIIEPREHPMLDCVCRLFAHGLARRGWGLTIVHGTENEAFVRDFIKDWRGTVFLRSCGKANLTEDEYNDLCLTEAFWTGIPTETILLFQTDALLLHTDGLDDLLLRFSYLGAPWDPGVAVVPGARPVFVGNGGLSLRRKSFCVRVCRYVRDSLRSRRFHNEDVMFAFVQEEERVVPRVADAVAFSVESWTPNLSRELGSRVPLGWHKTYLFPEIRHAVVDALRG